MLCWFTMSFCWISGTKRTRLRSALSTNLRAAGEQLQHQILSVTTTTVLCSLVNSLTPGERAKVSLEAEKHLFVCFFDYQELWTLYLVTRGMPPMTPTWARVTSLKAWTRVFWACVLGKDASLSSHPSWHTERMAMVITNIKMSLASVAFLLIHLLTTSKCNLLLIINSD